MTIHDDGLFPAPKVDWPTEMKKLARASHPETSHKAAAAIVEQLPKVYAEVLGMVTEYPGSTVSELALRYELRDPRHAGRRLPELVRLGLVRRGQPRNCRVTGMLAGTWVGGGLRIASPSR